MDRKGKGKMTDSDGDRSGRKPVTGFPLEHLNAPAYRWDTAAAAPTLEQHNDSFPEGTATAAAVRAALHTGEYTGMMSSSLAMAAAGELWDGTNQSMGMPAMQSFEGQQALVEMQNKLLHGGAFDMAMAPAPQGVAWSNDGTLPMRAAASLHDGSSTDMASSSVAAAAVERRGRNHRAITDQTNPISTIFLEMSKKIDELEVALSQQAQARKAAERREQQQARARLAAEQRELQIRAIAKQILAAAQQHEQASQAVEQRERQVLAAAQQHELARLAAEQRERQVLAAAQQHQQARLAAEQREREVLAVVQQRMQTTLALEHKVEALEQELAAARQQLQAAAIRHQALLGSSLAGNIQANIAEDTASSPAPARNIASSAAPGRNGATPPAPGRNTRP